MRTDQCQCGQTLFFDNTCCVRCQSTVGWCDACHRIVTLLPTMDGHFQCQHEDCQTKLKLCRNYTQNNICNWTLPAAEEAAYCVSCRLTEVIPDLSDPKHRKRWFQLEAAKRRLLYSLDQLGLPFRRSDVAADPPLRFQFLDPAGTDKPVTTGHAAGCITINLAEADEVEREKARVAFGEPQRTLMGHFRHEIGHYYWEVLVAGKSDASFRQVFGDETSPPYHEAQKRYYEQGPPPEWQEEYVSAYATMHPWEDFAESFACYLDMMSLLDTAATHQLKIEEQPSKLLEMILKYQQLAVILNEISRERGLLDLVPEVLTQRVVEKLSYVHELVENSGSR